MNKCALAIDIGASSGRHIIGYVEDGKIKLQEMYRFKNAFIEKDGHFCWDENALFQNIVEGMKQVKEKGFTPLSVGVDTWGVDYVLVTNKGQTVGNCYAYRDDRTKSVLDLLDEDEIYRETGIAKQSFNTVYQLMATDKEEVKKADRLLFMPDYFHYKLSGKMANEYTISSTSALLNANTNEFSKKMLNMMHMDDHLFKEKPQMPGTVLGCLTEEIQAQVGYNAQVILPPSHDTASAYLSIPAKDENAVYLSSGTWSLLGVELEKAHLTDEQSGFTNEGTYSGHKRFLKNIMGLWMIQNIHRELGEKYSFAQLAQFAEEGKNYTEIVDATDARFLAPKSMIEEIKKALLEQQKPLFKDEKELLSCVHRSLAMCYKNEIEKLEKLMHKTFTSINIVGGGSQNVVLNQLTASCTKRPVYAGPSEGTALGNIICQLIALGEIDNQQQARSMVKHSFEIQKYV